MTTGTPACRRDILSEDEEGALCLVREALAAARSASGPAGLHRIGENLAAVGVLAEEVGAARGTFRHRSARFSISTRADPPGSFEVRFIEERA